MAMFVAQLPEGAAAPTHQQLFEAAIPSAAQYYQQLIANHGDVQASYAALVGSSGGADAPALLLEDLQPEDGDAPHADHVLSASSNELHGTVEEAAWELLAAIDPQDSTPEEAASIIRELTKYFTARFPSQDRLPPVWQTFSDLLDKVLSQDNVTAEDIVFCGIREDIAGSGTALHKLVQSAVGRDMPSVVRSVGLLLDAGVDIHAEDSSGLTALCHAASLHMHPVFIRLVDGGAHGGQHTWALVEYRNLLLQTQQTPELKLCHQALKKVAARNRKVAWYFSWSLLFPSTTKREECIFQTESFSSCKVQPIVRNQLFKVDGAFNTVNTFGRRLVGRIGIENKTYGHLYLKVRPELPGVESAVRELARLLFGVNAMPYVELVRWSKAVKGTKGLGPGTPVLVSQGVPGLTLQEIITEKDEAKKNAVLHKLEKTSVSEALILALLTMPEDGKPDNYICEPNGDGEYRLIGIDNDHAFAPAVATEKGHKELKVKCCLFCLDEMHDKLAPKVRKDLLFIDAVSVVRNWVSRLKKRHAAHARLFQSEEEVTRLLRDKKEPCALGVPFRPGAVKRLCDKIVRMQSLINREPNCTHFELMKEVEPMLAIRYRIALDKKDLDVGQRFRDVDGEFFSRVTAGNYESMFNSRQMLSMNLLGMKTDAGVLLKMLKGEQYGPVQALEELESFATQWKQAELEKFMTERGLNPDLHLMPAHQIEDMMTTVDFQDVPTNTQQVLLNELRQKDMRRLDFTNCLILDDRFLESLIQFRNVTSIHLNGCLQINLSFGLLHAIAECCKALKEWCMSDLPQPRRIARATVTSVRALQLPLLEKMTLTRLPLLCEVRLEAPLLTRIDLTECPKLTVLEVHAPSLDRLDITDCENMQEQELAAFAQSCGSGSLAFVNVGLFGLTPMLTKLVFGATMIKSILSKGGERFWATAKRVASIADDEPSIEASVLLECTEEEIAWEALKNVFRIAGNDTDFPREVIGGGKPDVWQLAQDCARVSIAQNNAALARSILKVGAVYDWDVGSAVASVAILDGNIGLSMITAGESHGWELVKTISNVAKKDISLAETILSIGSTHNWASAETLASVAIDQPDLVLPLLALGARRDWNTVFHLATIAKTSKALVNTILKLGQKHDWQVAGLLAKCAANEPITRLTLINCPLEPEDAIAISELLQSNTNLEVAIFSGCNLGEDGGCLLADSLSGTASALKELWLWDCNFGPRVAEQFAKTITTTTTTIESLSFRGHAFGAAGGCAIASSLKDTKKLRELRIDDCLLEDATAFAFGAALAEQSSLQLLELSNASFGDEGGKAIAEGLAKNSILTKLILSNCGLGSASGSALGQAVESLTALKTLDLHGDVLGEPGCNAIVSGLLKNRSITNLRLWGCGAADSTAQLLSELLMHNSTLTTLAISLENMTADGVVKLGGGLLKHSGLKELRIGNNPDLVSVVVDTLADLSTKVVLV